MNQPHTAWTAGRDRSPSPQYSAGRWSGVRNFFQRQPEWILTGAMVGGALLAFLATKGRQSAQKPQFRQGYTAAQHGTRDNEPLWRTPSARMGATEEQVEDLTTPSTRALDAGTAGATGAAYELDPTSITGG